MGQLGRQSIPPTLAYDHPTAGSMADELLRTSPTPLPSNLKPCVATTPHAVAVDGASKARKFHGVGVAASPAAPRKFHGTGVSNDNEAFDEEGVWEEERHLDNSLYILHKWVMWK